LSPPGKKDNALPSDAPSQPRHLRVVMISKACLVGAYQRKLEEIAAHPRIDLTVIVPPSWKDSHGEQRLERAHTEGYDLLVMPLRFNGSYHLHYYPGLAGRLAALRPDIVHIDEEPYNLATALALRAARQAGAKSLFFTWQNILRRYPPPFSQMERWVLRHADCAIAGNSEAVGVWREKGYAGPLHVIPQFGVDPDLFAPSETQSEGDLFTVGYAGRLVPEKGLDVLIRAMSRLQGRCVLRLLGDGPQRRELQELAGVYNISGSVSFERPIPSTEMPGFYRRLDALVLPSRTRPNWKEQFGRVLIEAMACGVPVVGSASGAIPEVVGEAGMLFPEGDYEALAARLGALKEDAALRRRLALAGRARVQERFTQTYVAAQTVGVYREMIPVF
jgi:glycosyltransferase involved in cell wall biosynthesis